MLDVMLPGTDGLELMRWIRARGDLPVILLTARGDESDRIVGLELGADDYVTKPFSPRELAARVRTVLRRAPLINRPTQELAFGDVQLDAAQPRGEEAAAPSSVSPSRSSISSGSSPRTRTTSSRASS